MPAPYSDNLYSADGDGDDNQALSPTDGYFHASSASSRPRPLVPNILVEDPTLASRESKAWEAERERCLLSSDAGASSSSHTSRPAAPVLRHEAPPAYSPSSTNYQTFSPMGQEHPLEEQQPLLSHEPESMSTPPHEEPSRWRRIRSSVAKTNLRSKFRTILGTFVILSVVIILLGIMFDDSSNWDTPDYINDGPVGSHDDFTWNPPRICLDSPHHFPRTTTSVRLDRTKNLNIVQTVQRDQGYRGPRPHVSGEVILRPVEDDSPAAIELQVISNHESLGVNVYFDEESQLFKMTTPSRVDWDSNGAPCIQIRATIWVPRNSIINALFIETLHLDVDAEKGFDLQVLAGTAIRSVVGNINAPAQAPKDTAVPHTLSSREISIHTASGKVKGWYPLYDFLDIETVSGDISVNVGPKPAEDVKQATLRVRSASGKIELHELLNKPTGSDNSFPPRDYMVNVGTVSGDIIADVAASSDARFESQSGHLNLLVRPVLDSSTNPVVETDTKSGESHITVLEPLWTSTVDDTTTPALSTLRSKHNSISGTIRLRYPSSWEGHVSAQTISGSQEVRGRGLEVTHEGGPFGRRTRGRKGDGNSQLDVSSVSGDQFVIVGEE